MRLRTRISVAALAVASVVGGAAAGLIIAGPATAVAQEQETDTTVAVDRPSTVDEVLAELVADGVLTQEQADTVAEALEAARPARGFRGYGGHRFGVAIDEVADLLGLTIEDLAAELRAGSSLAEIAAANGADAEDVIDVLVAATQERLDAAVADGRLTEGEAVERAEDIEERITDMVNGEFDFGDRRSFGHRGHRGPGGDSDVSSDA